MASDYFDALVELQKNVEFMINENECRKSECDMLINSNKQLYKQIRLINAKLNCLDSDLAELQDEY